MSTTYFIANRQMRALALYEQATGVRVGGGSMEDAMERFRKAEGWLVQMAATEEVAPQQSAVSGAVSGAGGEDRLDRTGLSD